MRHFADLRFEMVCFFFFLEIVVTGLAPSSTLRAQESTETGSKALARPRTGSTYVVAHRGAHQGIPEKTLAAYQREIELGCDFVEIDVRTTKDGHLVSIHDATIDQYTVDHRTGTVSDMTLEELRELDIGSRISPMWAGQRIPTVREVFALCRGKIGIYLDVKDASLESLTAIAKEFDMEQNTLWYISAGRVNELRERSPRSWPMPDPGPQIYLSTLLEETKPHVVASTWRFFSPSFAEQCHSKNAIVIVDDGGRDSWNKLLEWGADGIQTDYPEELIQYIRSRDSGESTRK
jgi:glycerophosphoryl diester phosphodiesterase